VKRGSKLAFVRTLRIVTLCTLYCHIKYLLNNFQAVRLLLAYGQPQTAFFDILGFPALMLLWTRDRSSLSACVRIESTPNTTPDWLLNPPQHELGPFNYDFEQHARSGGLFDFDMEPLNCQVEKTLKIILFKHTWNFYQKNNHIPGHKVNLKSYPKNQY
jgi:hypothetical protein